MLITVVAFRWASTMLILWNRREPPGASGIVSARIYFLDVCSQTASVCSMSYILLATRLL